jgi:hypothetical protein
VAVLAAPGVPLFVSVPEAERALLAVGAVPAVQIAAFRAKVVAPRAKLGLVPAVVLFQCAHSAWARQDVPRRVPDDLAVGSGAQVGLREQVELELQVRLACPPEWAVPPQRERGAHD